MKTSNIDMCSLPSYFWVPLLLALALCGSCTSNQRRNELVILLEKRIETFDPRLSTDSAAERMRQLIFNGLTRKDERFNPIPDLCESFEPSGDGRSFTFRLRPQVRFHNGRVLSAADVKYTFDSLMAKETASGKKVELIANQVSVEVGTDPLTVLFRCGTPCPNLPNMIIPIGIIPEGMASQQAVHPIGTGPFEFEEYKDEQEVTLKSFKQYFGGAPSIERVKVKIVPDEGTREAELRKGNIDLVINADLNPAAVEGLKQAGGLIVALQGGTNITHIGVNLADPILKNRLVRQAIAYSLDREKIIREVLRGQAEPAQSILPTQQWAFEPGVTKYNYDPERAKQLLIEAGFSSQNGSRLKLTLKTSTLPISRKIAEAIQEQLKQSEITLDVISIERQKLTQDMVEGYFQLYLNQIVGGNQSTDIFRYLYYSKSIPPNGQNRSRFMNAQVDRLLEEAQTAAEKRKAEIFSEVQKILAVELPQIYLWYPSSVVISSKRVKNIKIDPSGDWQVIRNFKLEN